MIRGRTSRISEASCGHRSRQRGPQWPSVEARRPLWNQQARVAYVRKDSRLTNENAVAVTTCRSVKTAALTPTERFLDLIENLAGCIVPPLQIPPPWSVGPMMGTA